MSLKRRLMAERRRYLRGEAVDDTVLQLLLDNKLLSPREIKMMQCRERMMEELNRKLEGVNINNLNQYAIGECERLDALESKIKDELKWKPEPWQVTAILSACGGVGKTTLSIAMAQQLVERRKRVCIVDSNDDAPALQTYFPPANDIKNNWFFAEWFCRDNAQYMDIPDGLVQMIPGYDNYLGIIPNSMHFSNITMLDSTQRGGRPPLGDNRYFEHRLIILASNLIKKSGFDGVIFDTKSGLTHLTFELWKATASAKLSKVYVARPRPADLALLLLEDDVLFHPNIIPNSAIALNFYDAKEEPTNDSIATRMSDFNFFEQYEQKMMSYKPKDKNYRINHIIGHLGRILQGLAQGYDCICEPVKDPQPIPYCPTIPQLHRAGYLGREGSKYQYASEIIRKTEKMQNLARQVLDRLGAPKRNT